MSVPFCLFHSHSIPHSDCRLIVSLQFAIAIMQDGEGRGNFREKPVVGIIDGRWQSPLHSPPRQRKITNSVSGVTTPPRRASSHVARSEKVQITLQTPPREIQKKDPAFIPSPKRVRFSVFFLLIFYCSFRTCRLQYLPSEVLRNALQLLHLSRWMLTTILP